MICVSNGDISVEQLWKWTFSNLNELQPNSFNSIYNGISL